MKALALFPSLLLCLAYTTAGAQIEGLPADARLEEEVKEPLSEIRFPIAEALDGTIETRTVRGRVTRQAWQIPASDLTTLQILKPLAAGLQNAGFETLIECKDRECGGFDFRYALELLPEPSMHVDLGDFLYLLARRGSGQEAEHVAFVVSRSSERGFVHMTRVEPDRNGGGRSETVLEGQSNAWSRPKPRALPSLPDPIQAAPAGPLIETLVQAGRAVLKGLSFETGSSRLSDNEFPALAELADWMKQNPKTRIVLVGHTDAEGTLASNIALSRARANSVRARLSTRYGVPGARMAAEGVGFLSPIASNAHESGRNLNRRVEVVLVATE